MVICIASGTAISGLSLGILVVVVGDVPVLSLFCRSILLLGKSEDAEPNILCCGAACVRCPAPARLLLLSAATRADCLRLDPTRQQACLLSTHACAGCSGCVRALVRVCDGVCCGHTCSNPCVTDQTEVKHVKHGPNSHHGFLKALNSATHKLAGSWIPKDVWHGCHSAVSHSASMAPPHLKKTKNPNLKTTPGPAHQSSPCGPLLQGAVKHRPLL